MQGHDTHHHDVSQLSDRRIIWSVLLNVGLTVAEVVGGILSGSVALIADALHNFNDAMALVVTLVARRVSRRRADNQYTFGYRRAELIGATINLTALIVVGLFLISEAIKRLISPEEINGWVVIIVAAIALVVDIGTAWLLWAMSKGSLNVRAAFIHNVSDALASVAVLIGGVCVVLWEITVVDPLLTLLIAGYILYQGFKAMRGAVRILMQAAPAGLDLQAMINELNALDGVDHLHHVHVWQIDEHRRSLEAHVMVSEADSSQWSAIKQRIKQALSDRFDIDHSTLEFEGPGERVINGDGTTSPSTDPDEHTHP
ncbi:MAG: cation diffusion facilitator family transporter [Phycisphaeraceae bacterium]